MTERYQKQVGESSKFLPELLLKTVRQHKETAYKVGEAFTKIGNYCAAHDDVIDASWVAKVIEGTRSES